MLRRAAENRAAYLLALAMLACTSAPPLSPRDLADANDTGRGLTPRSANERELLATVGSLPNGTSQRVGASIVVAEAPYVSASGRTCRGLSVSAQGARDSKHRLACSNGATWFFVPDVFGGGDAPE